MKRYLSTVIAVFAALAMSLGLVSAATAAKPTAYVSSTSSPLLALGVNFGLFTMEGFGGTTIDPASKTINAEVIGNPDASGIIISKGGLTLSKADGTSLTIKNIKYDTRRGQVTGVIEGERVLLYTAKPISETTSQLIVAPEGGAYMRKFVNFLGVPADGSDFGTSTLKKA
ncbi:hypothetical protein [Kribbia dieselivorans]|uniref:hypothetical protein n=1 Tax=Kribbia dieselivorans TaxID=331526 RepID=UPI0008397C6C|nr:hypothetical protein [Kribbia dieselivorans]